MIHEFALDPGVLSTWQAVRYFIEKFGCEHGRMISRFPKKWESMVYEESKNCSTIERKKIEEYLLNKDINIKRRLIHSGREYNAGLQWLQNAAAQHAKEPFHAIITKENSTEKEYVLIADELNDTMPLWNVKKGDTVARKAAILSARVRPLLQYSSEILFIDQHFSPDAPRYQKTLSAFTDALRGNTKISRIEYHTTVHDISRAHFENHPKLKRLIPKEMKISFIRWEKIDSKDALHPRYVLTNIGGISIEVGLDEGEEGATTDVSLLDYDRYVKRWSDYQRASSPFKFIDEITVIGQRT